MTKGHRVGVGPGRVGRRLGPVRARTHVAGCSRPVDRVWTAARRYAPFAAFTSASTPARIAGGRSDHTATTAANSGSVGVAGVGAVADAGGVGEPKPPPLLPDLLPPDSETGVFPAGFAGSSSPVSPIGFGSAASRRHESACGAPERRVSLDRSGETAIPGAVGWGAAVFAQSGRPLRERVRRCFRGRLRRRVVRDGGVA